MAFKLDNTLNANSGDIFKAYVGGRQGVENVPILIILRTTLKTKKLNI